MSRTSFTDCAPVVLCLVLLLHGPVGVLGQATCPQGCSCTPTLASCDPNAIGGRAWLYNTTLPSPLSPTLTALILSGNDLTLIRAEQLQNVTRLARLLLSNNRIKSLDKDVFSRQTSLEELDLSNNNLRTLPLGIFANLISLKIIKLANNWITTLPVLATNITVNVFTGPTGLTRLSLHGNSLHCDCTTAWLPSFIVANSAIIDQVASITCQAPASASGVALNAIENAIPPLVFPCTQPSITTPPVDSVVNTSSTVQLSCATSGSPNPEATWYKDDVMVVLDYYRLDTAQSGGLIISPARHSDEGLYHCNVSSQEGSTASPAAQLSVDEETCFNGRRDMDETDVDCGGPMCNPCALDLKCLLDRDCADNTVCYGSHQLTSSLLYVSPENQKYQTCAQESAPGSELVARLRASLRGRTASLPALNGSEDLGTLAQEVHTELSTQLEVPKSYLSNIRLEARARHRRPQYTLRFTMSAGGVALTTTALNEQLHRGMLHGTLAYLGSNDVQLVF